MSEEHVNTVAVGTKLMSKYAGRVSVQVVESISKTGRLTLANGTVLDANLKRRGAGPWGPRYYHRISEDDAKEIRRQECGDDLEKARRMIGKFSDVQIERLAAAVQEALSEVAE